MPEQASIAAAPVVEKMGHELFQDLTLREVNGQPVTCLCGNGCAEEVCVVMELTEGEELEVRNLSLDAQKTFNLGPKAWATKTTQEGEPALKFYNRDGTSRTGPTVTFPELYRSPLWKGVRLFNWME